MDLKLLAYIKTKSFVKHLTISSIVAIVLLWLAFKSFGIYTHHGDLVDVPDFTGKTVGSLDQFIADKDVRYQIIDSLFNPEEKPGRVIRQDPEPGNKVKSNRTIYLYVTSVLPPQMVMPKLVDRSLRQASAMLESYGLKLGKVKFVSDPCTNCILKQIFAGKEIEPGTAIKKGSTIDLVVGKGNTSEQTTVPNVIGLTLCEAKTKLSAAGVSAGALIFDQPVKDSCKALVYRHSPVSGNTVNMGSSIDLYLTLDKSKIDPSAQKETPNFDND